MKSNLSRGALLMVLGLMVGCSSSEQQPDAEPERIESSKLDQLPITDIPFDPSVLSDEWITILLHDNFSDELELETFIELRAPDGRRQ